MEVKNEKMEKDRKYSEIIGDFLGLMQESAKRYHALEKQIKREDQLTQDLLHMIELEGGDYRQRNRMATELRTCRRDRRYYKDLIEELAPIYHYYDANRKTIDRLSKVLGEVKKEEEYHADRAYHPRVRKGAEKDGEDL